MKSKILFILTVLFVAIGIVLWNEYGDAYLRMPKVRVGPLHTEKPLDAATMRLLILGDSGTGNENQYRVASAMEKVCLEKGADAILLLGDNFYMHGVADVDDAQWAQKVEKPYGSPCLSKIPIYPILGNHDYHQNPEAQILYSRINERWQMPNRFYSVRFGSLLNLVGFDSQTTDFCFRPEFCTVDFTLKSLKTTADWQIVIAHHPLISSSIKGYGYRGGVRGALLRNLLCDDADFWISGHAHHLEHLAPSDCHTEFLISGGGGANLTEIGELNEGSKFAASKHGFLELTLSQERADFAFYSDQGEKIYSGSKENRKFSK